MKIAVVMCMLLFGASLSASIESYHVVIYYTTTYDECRIEFRNATHTVYCEDVFAPAGMLIFPRPPRGAYVCSLFNQTHELTSIVIQIPNSPPEVLVAAQYINSTKVSIEVYVFDIDYDSLDVQLKIATRVSLQTYTIPASYSAVFFVADTACTIEITAMDQVGAITVKQIQLTYRGTNNVAEISVNLVAGIIVAAIFVVAAAIIYLRQKRISQSRETLLDTH